MTYVYIHTELLDTEPFLHATPEQIGTWLMIYKYCARQENSGRIPNAKNWTEKMWLKTAQIGIPGESPIWSWKGSDFVLLGYDLSNQVLAQRKRLGGKLGADRRWNHEGKNGTPIRTPIRTTNGTTNGKVK